ncbi:YppG family protein [Oceanobacillus luteolus]|uniref:YppG family protein n=1 Tax=Oceanobacillus luteolus TaxID=1274358 RepID=A0ABW4HU44_9BACI|nr:YppG family protein [Oceanobacillus luteolus]MCM3742202.1 YppG family protein [Oceanobacillus luteolus]
MDDRTRHYHQAFQFRQSPPFTQQMPPYQMHTPYHPQQPMTPYELFAKPPQPLDVLYANQDPNMANQNQNVAPGMLGAFTDSNGQVNLDKMMGTINQLASTYHQVSPIVKQLSSLFRAFRA